MKNTKRVLMNKRNQKGRKKKPNVGKKENRGAEKKSKGKEET